MSSWAVVAFGSNVAFGSLAPAQVLEAARHRVAALPGVVSMAYSSVWTTAPVNAKGDAFANAVGLLYFAQGHALDAEQLLAELLGIEQVFGRDRSAAQVTALSGPSPARTLDLDLVMASTGAHQSRDLILPHPRAHERVFVLGPLAEIAPGLLLELPDGRRCTVAEQLAACRPPMEQAHAG